MADISDIYIYIYKQTIYLNCVGFYWVWIVWDIGPCCQSKQSSGGLGLGIQPFGAWAETTTRHCGSWIQTSGPRGRKSNRFLSSIPHFSKLLYLNWLTHHKPIAFDEIQLPKREETLSEGVARFGRVIHALADKYPSENLLLITHGERQNSYDISCTFVFSIR